MTVVTGIPAGVRRPGSYTQFDASGALQGTPAKPVNVLLVGGKKLSGGSGTDGVIYKVTGNTGGDGIWGVGAMTAEMARAFKAHPGTSLIGLWGVSLADDVSGVAAAGAFVVTGTATADGVLALYVGGAKVPVLVLTGETPTQIGVKIVAALALNARLPVTGVNTTGTVATTCKWKGPSGNGIALEVNRSPDDVYPTSVSVAVTPMASGATAPAVTALIAALPQGTTYDAIVTGSEDDASMDSWEAEALSRWQWDDQRSMLVFAGFRGAYSAASTYLSSRNAYLASVACAGRSPTAPWIWATDHCAIRMTESDPARPCNTLPYINCVAPLKSEEFLGDELEMLLHEGGSTYTVDAGGNCLVERMVTTYVTNSASQSDPTWLDIQTPMTLAYIRYAWNFRLKQKYPRHKIGDDGKKPRPGQPIMTPSTMRGELIGFGGELYDAGLIEDADAFVASALIERPSDDANRMDSFVSPDLVNGMMVFATGIGFRL